MSSLDAQIGNSRQNVSSLRSRLRLKVSFDVDRRRRWPRASGDPQFQPSSSSFLRSILYAKGAYFCLTRLPVRENAFPPHSRDRPTLLRRERERGCACVRASCAQCDQIGQYLTVLGYKFSDISGPNIWQFSRLL